MLADCTTEKKYMKRTQRSCPSLENTLRTFSPQRGGANVSEEGHEKYKITHTHTLAVLLVRRHREQNKTNTGGRLKKHSEAYTRMHTTHNTREHTCNTAHSHMMLRTEPSRPNQAPIRPPGEKGRVGKETNVTQTRRFAPLFFPLSSRCSFLRHTGI